ncbi:RNA recognition motif domain-containing protein [Mucilaginibacter sp.]|uniref:RNA recognition motif domain-containing protein n=1 Tax=Mucilaginibacter sp. TaxID=1882438 RepID=UPI0035BC7B6A
MKLFIANVAFNLAEAELKQMLTQFGQVASIKLISDPETGKRKGYGFIEMPVREQALRAIAGLNDKMIGGRKLSVKEAVEKDQGSTGFKSKGNPPQRNYRDNEGEIDGNRW